MQCDHSLESYGTALSCGVHTEYDNDDDDDQFI